jgi:hypothetical protein
MAEDQKREPGVQEQAGRPFEQVIPVNSEKLRLIKINNVTGRTHIRGGQPGRITIRATSPGSFNYTPTVEFKNEGATVEITSTLNTGSDWMVKVLRGFNVAEDSGEWSYEDNSWKDEVAGWPDPDEENLSREERQRLRDERQRQRDERQRQRDERRRVRHETRENIRQAHEFARQGQDFWSSLEGGLEPLGEILNSVGRTISQAFSSPDDLYIEIPAGVELEAKSVSGGLEVANMTGYCVIKNTSGSIDLNRLSGGLRVKGISGKVQGRELSGRVEVKVSSGSVELTNCRFTGLDLSVTSGRILVETALAGPPDGDYKINSSNGAIKLLLPRDSRASIDCRTLNGRLSMPRINSVEIKNRPGQSQSRIELNGGGRKVSVNTLNGNLEVALYDHPGENTGWSNNQASWPVPPVPPVPPVAPAWPSSPSAGSSDWGFQTPQPAFRDAPPPPSTQNQGWNAPGEASQPARPANPEPLVTPAPWNKAEANQAEPENPAPVVEPDQPAAGPDSDKRTRQLELLQAIERGEISVDEGMRRLGEIE